MRTTIDDGASIEVVPATADRFDVVDAVLAPANPDAPACWCLSTRIPNAEFRALEGAARPARLRRYAQEARAPGVVALVDGEAAGWCSVAPRIQHHRLMRSRTIPMLDEDAWSIVCFVVRAPFRRRGVADHLLAGAVAFAEAEGARVVEGYPIDAASGRVSSAFAYVGSTTLFERAGFERAAETTSRSGGAPRWVMRRELAA